MPELVRCAGTYTHTNTCTDAQAHTHTHAQVHPHKYARPSTPTHPKQKRHRSVNNEYFLNKASHRCFGTIANSELGKMFSLRGIDGSCKYSPTSAHGNSPPMEWDVGISICELRKPRQPDMRSARRRQPPAYAL